MLDIFTYHTPDEWRLRRITRLREDFSWMMEQIEAETEPCRYSNLAKTALEEAAMWAVKAVVLGD